MNIPRQDPPFGSKPPGQAAPGPLAKLIAFLLSAAFLTLALMFSLVAVAVVAVLGIGLGGWLWWKTRALRKQMRATEARRTGHAATAAPGNSTIIEGEFVRETTASEHLLR
ncbi:MAG: hypothetical protein ACK4FP_06005 [Azonexus sp.]